MATTSSIGTTARTYATIQLWHDAFGTGGWIGQCFNDSEFAVTAAISLTGKSTNVTDFITLTTGAAQSFVDNAGVQSNPLRYDATKGVGVRRTTNYNQLFNISEDYCTLTKLQIAHAGTSINQQPITNTANHSTYDKLIVENSGNAGTFATVNMGGTTALLFTNSLVVARNAGVGVGNGYGGATCVNVTAVCPSDVTATAAAFACPSGTMTLKNVAGYGFTAFTSGAGTFAGSNNSSDQAIGFGSSNQASKTYASQFIATANATRDFRAKTGGDLIDHGVTDTSDAGTTDIAGTTRPSGSSWDIGAWELVAAGGGGTVKPGLLLLGAGFLAMKRDFGPIRTLLRGLVGR